MHLGIYEWVPALGRTPPRIFPLCDERKGSSGLGCGVTGKRDLEKNKSWLLPAKVIFTAPAWSSIKILSLPKCCPALGRHHGCFSSWNSLLCVPQGAEREPGQGQAVPASGGAKGQDLFIASCCFAVRATHSTPTPAPGLQDDSARGCSSLELPADSQT